MSTNTMKFYPLWLLKDTYCQTKENRMYKSLNNSSNCHDLFQPYNSSFWFFLQKQNSVDSKISTNTMKLHSLYHLRDLPDNLYSDVAPLRLFYIFGFLIMYSSFSFQKYISPILKTWPMQIKVQERPFAFAFFNGPRPDINITTKKYCRFQISYTTRIPPSTE